MSSHPANSMSPRRRPGVCEVDFRFDFPSCRNLTICVRISCASDWVIPHRDGAGATRKLRLKVSRLWVPGCPGLSQSVPRRARVREDRARKKNNESFTMGTIAERQRQCHCKVRGLHDASQRAPRKWGAAPTGMLVANGCGWANGPNGKAPRGGEVSWST